MYLTRKATNKAALLTTASALVILLAGCQNAPPASTNISGTDTSPLQSVKNIEPDSPQKTYSEQTDSDLLIKEPHLNRVDTTSDTNAETSTIRENDGSKAAVKTESQDSEWSDERPLLHGLAIGDKETTVNKLHGLPLDSYRLEEASGSINVLEYDGFALGINHNQKIQFIEVYSELISPGLSGLRIGDTPETALHSLGKPDKQTTYLLTYTAKNALLKLDLDPEHNQIVSIKLLALS
ncbi:hypothetical protein BK133_07540 [Paenibacillus sp. FSL H8-0548]|uniref:hypothetical protein n=1 Tax=Paenibacillus sp. FSL H8-0548 TaxID=1920422 RepID=UPI00096F6860|nr:hypothetical protein [Paenibacillus sp. FSL H8-0548]OMF37053.1 hypothetical protein BK133_07540 [Paenibacillus sp. FSL H8-0548]